jgi:hypothetical protein
VFVGVSQAAGTAPTPPTSPTNLRIIK